MFSKCVHLRELNRAQTGIIEEHLKRHLWCQHIADEEEGKDDFVEKFGGIMRAVFCGFACPDSLDCETAQKHLPQGTMLIAAEIFPLPSIYQCAHFEELMIVFQTMVANHLDAHKWFQQIADLEEGRKDFMEKFGEIMQQLYCGHVCLDRYKCMMAGLYLPIAL